MCKKHFFIKVIYSRLKGRGSNPTVTCSINAASLQEIFKMCKIAWMLRHRGGFHVTVQWAEPELLKPSSSATKHTLHLKPVKKTKWYAAAVIKINTSLHGNLLVSLYQESSEVTQTRQRSRPQTDQWNESRLAADQSAASLAVFLHQLTSIWADRPVDVFPEGVWWAGRGDSEVKRVSGQQAPGGQRIHPSSRRVAALAAPPTATATQNICDILWEWESQKKETNSREACFPAHVVLYMQLFVESTTKTL